MKTQETFTNGPWEMKEICREGMQIYGIEGNNIKIALVQGSKLDAIAISCVPLFLSAFQSILNTIPLPKTEEEIYVTDLANICLSKAKGGK